MTGRGREFSRGFGRGFGFLVNGISLNYTNQNVSPEQQKEMLT